MGGLIAFASVLFLSQLIVMGERGRQAFYSSLVRLSGSPVLLSPIFTHHIYLRDSYMQPSVAEEPLLRANK